MSSDAPVVARLRRAGAAILGKTNMTEFAFSGVGLNPHYGTPANPADAEFKTALHDSVTSVLNGQAEPEAAMAAAQETAQSALDEAWAKLESEQ